MQGNPMGVDPALLAALNEALQKAPDSVPLRLHVAGLLMQSGGEEAALQHYVALLTKDPASVPALEGAAAAAEAIGDRTRASGYRQLLNALSGAAAKSAPAPVDPAPTPERNERVPVTQEAGDSTPWWEAEWPNLHLKDVGGMQQVKRRLDVAFLGPMRNPELRKA